jgi:hypothetical protein
MHSLYLTVVTHVFTPHSMCMSSKTSMQVAVLHTVVSLRHLWPPSSVTVD